MLYKEQSLLIIARQYNGYQIYFQRVFVTSLLK